MTKEETEIMLFEEYMDALIDRRTFQQSFPESNPDIEEACVTNARETLITFLKENVKP